MHANLELHLVPGAAQVADHDSHLAVLGELHRVAYQVEDDLPHAQRITHQHVRYVRRRVEQQLKALVVGLLRDK
ncbi:hypothetical protein D9M71_816110 [compost metagenome]